MIYTESDISKELDILAPMLANRSLDEIEHWLDILLKRMNEHRTIAFNFAYGLQVDYSKSITIETNLP